MINNNWIFGDNCGLDFTTSPPTATSGFAISTTEGCASVSDENGNLLMYTDGSTIWNSSNGVITNTLKGHKSSTQSAIIVPNPGNNGQYYVFTADGATGNDEHFNGGLVDVASNSFQPLDTLMTMPDVEGFSPVEKVTAVQHSNCQDYWVMTLMQKGDLGLSSGAGFLRIFLVTASGVQHFSDTPLGVSVSDIGYMKASSDGGRIGIINTYASATEIYVYPFDNTTGIADPIGLQTIQTNNSNNYGLEFSPDSNLLYYAEFNTGNIYQVELSVSLVPNVVGSVTALIGALQLGRDGAIYIAQGNRNSVAAILEPNLVGSACNVTDAYVALPSDAVCKFGLPNLIASICEDDCDCEECEECEECNCNGCNGCDEKASEHNEELIKRAKSKFNIEKSAKSCEEPFKGECEKGAIDGRLNLEPCFSFHWGDSPKDQIGWNETEVFYLTVCNRYNDIQYNGLRVTKVRLSPNKHKTEDLQIVPDVLINFDCLAPCSCQTREFAIITSSKETIGEYKLEVEYCYEEIVISDSAASGMVSFPVLISKE